VYWDIVGFQNKEYAVSVSSMLKDDFGVARWDLESNKCWFSSPFKLDDSEGHTVISGYDLALIWYDVYVAVSIYKMGSAKVYIVDGTNLEQKISPTFVSLAGKGTGRVDTFSDAFQEFKMVTCIIDSGNLLCESINYVSGTSIQTMG
jgi:hypothetical protein